MVGSRRDRLAPLNLLILGLSSFVAAYGIIKTAGLFAPPVDNIFRAFHEKPPQICLYLIGILTAIKFVRGESRPKDRPHVFFWAGVFFMAFGLVISSFVRFEGRIILTEGQQFFGRAAEFAEGSLYLGKRASIPPFRLAAEVVTPGISKDGRTVRSIRLGAGYQAGASPLRHLDIGSLLPTFSNGNIFRTLRFGYSPLYRVTDGAGLVLEESFVSLDIFPSSAEDSIRTVQLPHTYYLRYFPSGTPDPGAEASKNGKFQVRIVRNLELLYRGMIALKEPVPFDTMEFSIEDVRKWAEIRVVKDHGMVIFCAGLVLSAVSAIVLYLRNRYDTENCRRGSSP